MMLDHVKQVIDGILGGASKNLGPIQHLVRQINQEVNRLNSLDFEPAARAKLIGARAKLAQFADATHFSVGPMKESLKEILPLLDLYRGLGSGGNTRIFSYLSDPDLRPIIERDYAELTLKLFPSGAWKSTVIMAGSILEAVLFDVLSNPLRAARSNAAPRAPRRAGSVIDIATGDWTLAKLIEVAVDIGVLPGAREDAIDQVLRDYRNFVHPKKEVRSQHACGEAEAGLAKHGLDAVCNHFQQTL